MKANAHLVSVAGHFLQLFANYTLLRISLDVRFPWTQEFLLLILVSFIWFLFTFVITSVYSFVVVVVAVAVAVLVFDFFFFQSYARLLDLFIIFFSVRDVRVFDL